MGYSILSMVEKDLFEKTHTFGTENVIRRLTLADSFPLLIAECGTFDAASCWHHPFFDVNSWKGTSTPWAVCTLIGIKGTEPEQALNYFIW